MCPTLVSLCDVDNASTHGCIIDMFNVVVCIYIYIYVCVCCGVLRMKAVKLMILKHPKLQKEIVGSKLNI